MAVKVLVGEALETLRTLPDQAVNCIVTSPPYYGLRDYGTATWEGGDPECEHTTDGRWYTEKTASLSSSEAFFEAGPDNAARLKKGRWREKGACTKCGAIHADDQIGLEETPEEFITKLVAVFREARRVLRDDGVAFINIGDSYAGSGRGGNPPESEHQKQATNKGSISMVGQTARFAAVTKKAGERRVPLSAGFHDNAVTAGVTGRAWVPPPAGLKQKDLIGIPWMLAFALRADGWYLRQEIIWAKPNPMPESVRDRCTKSHEHVFLLSKSQRYLFDAEAISEPVAPASIARLSQDIENQRGSDRVPGKTNGAMKAVGNDETRNKRDVWTIATEPSSIAHYAMMPTELAKTCIMAGCPLGGTVLDMFGGAGTTGLVADRLQRSAILIELSPEHAGTARERLQGDMGMFGEIA